jgi:hypothetical protein
VIETIRSWLRLPPRVPKTTAAATAAPGRGWRWKLRASGLVLLVLAVFFSVLGWYWSREPSVLWVNEKPPTGRPAPGYATVDTLTQVVSWMLEKPGGFLSNDMMPPGVWLDNMPSFERGALTQSRDLARILRNYYSRSQSQSTEDPDLATAEAALNTDHESWFFPPAETKYNEALGALDKYKARLIDGDPNDAQFYARADNLREWLAVVELRLGNLSQRLSASVGQARVNTDFAGAPASEPGNVAPEVLVKTPYFQVDDVFYEGRGTAWALLLFLRSAQFDFEGVLEDKNAVVSLRQIIRELEEGLKPIHSPIIMNGQGFGMFPNHSLVLASYLSRAHSAVIDLRELLERG